MDYLTRISKNDDISVYQILGNDTRVNCFVFSTPETRKICNKPEIHYIPFQRMLQAGLSRLLDNYPKELPRDNVMTAYILRGGLSFDVREDLFDNHGIVADSSFVTCERKKILNSFRPRDNKYNKFAIPDDANVFLGDISATNITGRNFFRKLGRRSQKNGKQIRQINFFTIGSDWTEKLMNEVDEDFRYMFKDFEETNVFFIEGRFGLADKKSKLRIKKPKTDLLRHPALLAPEFEISQYENVTHPLEKCAVYDGGSRAFQTKKYLAEVRKYWEKLGNEGEKGFTLFEALKERWPEKEYGNLSMLEKHKGSIWEYVPKTEIEMLYEAYRNRWTPEFTEASQERDSLVRVCEDRLKKLENVALVQKEATMELI